MGEHGDAGAVAPARGSGNGETHGHRSGATRRVRYTRLVHASPEDVVDAIVRTVGRLGYPSRGEDLAVGEISFEAATGIVTASATGAGAGSSTIAVEFTGLSWRGVGSSAVVILPGIVLGAAVKAAEAYFAYGFLDNVARTLQGRAVGRDSARIPLLTALRRGLDIEES